jgi:hypothetical protein
VTSPFSDIHDIFRVRFFNLKYICRLSQHRRRLTASRCSPEQIFADEVSPAEIMPVVFDIEEGSEET